MVYLSQKLKMASDSKKAGRRAKWGEMWWWWWWEGLIVTYIGYRVTFDPVVLKVILGTLGLNLKYIENG